MRDAACDEVPDAERQIGPHLRVSVLIVEGREGEPTVHRNRFTGRGPDLRGDREAFVERDVPSAETEDRELGFGPRQDRTPDLHRGVEAPVRILVGERRRALVDPRVVCEVTARSEDHLDRDIGRPPLAQTFGNEVEEPAAAGAHHDLPRERPVFHETRGKTSELVQVRAHPVQAAGRAIPAERALVSGDAGELQAGGSSNAFDDLHGLLRRATAGAASGVAELDQDAERPDRSRRSEPPIEELDAFDGVDVAEELHGRVKELLGRPSDRRLVDELVRDQDPSHSGQANHAGLSRRGGRDAPRTGLELASPELRSHRRLPVRSELDVRPFAEVRHQPHVVTQRRIAQDQDRRREIAERPSLSADLADRDRIPREGEAPSESIDRHAVEELVRERDRSKGAHRADASTAEWKEP